MRKKLIKKKKKIFRGKNPLSQKREWSTELWKVKRKKNKSEQKPWNKEQVESLFLQNQKNSRQKSTSAELKWIRKNMNLKKRLQLKLDRLHLHMTPQWDVHSVWCPLMHNQLKHKLHEKKKQKQNQIYILQ